MLWIRRFTILDDMNSLNTEKFAFDQRTIVLSISAGSVERQIIATIKRHIA